MTGNKHTMTQDRREHSFARFALGLSLEKALLAVQRQPSRDAFIGMCGDETTGVSRLASLQWLRALASVPSSDVSGSERLSFQYTEDVDTHSLTVQVPDATRLADDRIPSRPPILSLSITCTVSAGR